MHRTPADRCRPSRSRRINYTLAATGNVGISNISPWAPLNIGSVDSVSDSYISFSKNTGIYNRICLLRYLAASSILESKIAPI
jgi:hypothetical protein